MNGMFVGTGYIVAMRNNIVLFSGYFENYTTFHYINSALIEYSVFKTKEQMDSYILYKTKGNLNNDEVIYTTIENNIYMKNEINSEIDNYIKDIFIKPNRLNLIEIAILTYICLTYIFSFSIIIFIIMVLSFIILNIYRETLNKIIDFVTSIFYN